MICFVVFLVIYFNVVDVDEDLMKLKFQQTSSYYLPKDNLHEVLDLKTSQKAGNPLPTLMIQMSPDMHEVKA